MPCPFPLLGALALGDTGGGVALAVGVLDAGDVVGAGDAWPGSGVAAGSAGSGLVSGQVAVSALCVAKASSDSWESPAPKVSLEDWPNMRCVSWPRGVKAGLGFGVGVPGEGFATELGGVCVTPGGAPASPKL